MTVINSGSESLQRAYTSSPPSHCLYPQGYHKYVLFMHNIIMAAEDRIMICIVCKFVCTVNVDE